MPLVFKQIHVLRKVAILDVTGPAANVALDQVARRVIVEWNAGDVLVEQRLGLRQQLQAPLGVGFFARGLEQCVIAWIGITAVVLPKAGLEQLQKSVGVGIVSDPSVV